MPEFYSNVYNIEAKERFLESIDESQYPHRWWERLFEKTYMFEENKQKDFYSFTVPEILDFYKFLDIATIAPLVVYNTNAIKYAQWALNENLITDGQNHFDGLDVEILTTCISKIKIDKSILSYDKFKNLILRRILNDQDKFVFFCLFEGIKGKDYQDIIDMKISDIDEIAKTVQLGSGRVVEIPQDFIDIAHQADRQITYYALTDSNLERTLVPGLTIYKEKHNSTGGDTNRTVYNTIVRNIRVLEELSDVVTAKSIRESGFIYYLNKRAEELGKSVEYLLTNPDTCKDIIDKYQFNIQTRKRWLLQYEGHLK